MARFLLELAVLLAVIYLPMVQKFLGTYSLTLNDWLILVALALTIFPVLELVKWLERRDWFGAVVEEKGNR